MGTMDELITELDTLVDDLKAGEMFRNDIALAAQEDFDDQFANGGMDEAGNTSVWRENKPDYEDWKAEMGYTPGLMEATGNLRANITGELVEQMEIDGKGSFKLIWEAINVPDLQTEYGTFGSVGPGESYADYYQNTPKQERLFVATPNGLANMGQAMADRIEKRIEALE